MGTGGDATSWPSVSEGSKIFLIFVTCPCGMQSVLELDPAFLLLGLEARGVAREMEVIGGTREKTGM